MQESIYRRARRNAATTNACFRNAGKAGEHLLIERTRLLDIENERIMPRPDEVVAMANVYKSPEICSYYCSHECPVGKIMDYPEIDKLNFSEITTSLISSMHLFGKTTDKICAILQDHKISENEMEDFKKVLGMLDEISDYSDALKLWAKQHNII
jgi:hypothetical protein